MPLTFMDEQTLYARYFEMGLVLGLISGVAIGVVLMYLFVIAFG